MIKGRGLLAKALEAIDSEDYFFYANGVSNSVLVDIPNDNFEALEIKNIAQNIGNKMFVYFSTALVNAKENHSRPYVQHKRNMESLTKELFANYTIVRTSNLVGYNPWNTHTLFNFLYNSLKAGAPVSIIETATRNILDVDHFIILLHYYLTNFPQKNNTVNIVNPVSYNMKEILTQFENTFSKAFIKSHTEISIAQFEAPCEFSASLIENCKIELADYLATVIKKYYQSIISFA